MIIVSVDGVNVNGDWQPRLPEGVDEGGGDGSWTDSAVTIINNKDPLDPVVLVRTDIYSAMTELQKILMERRRAHMDENFHIHYSFIEFTHWLLAI